MAAHERLNSKESLSSPALIQQLATVLPKGITFKIYHLSTPPTRTSAIYSAPPGARPDRTYCESHFLAASIQTSADDSSPEPTEVLIFAIEVLIYSTAYLTTFFVSKADSTGYLHLLKLPKGSPSPLKEISAAFLRHLVEQRQRQNIQSIISLFARAQDQYLFPGSVENNGKHVLDDRGLVRWWCRVLDPLMDYPNTSSDAPIQPLTSPWKAVEGYLIVPGLDTYETLSYVPSKLRTACAGQRWTMGHPLQEISRHPEEPPRCLIPYFPDDPKARFLDELDDEISKSSSNDSMSGQWKSIKSIDQFWDMMAYRQECSAGRLVGFIWVVFSPIIQHHPTESVIGDSQIRDNEDSASFPPIPKFPELSSTPATSFTTSSQIYPTSSPFKPNGEDVPSASQQSARSSKPSAPKRKKLCGPIIPREPRIKTQNKNYLLERPENTAYYIWSSEGRGQVIVEESDYKRVTELLLRLDFANLDLASGSSKRWINEVRSGTWGSMSDAWGQTVTGTKTVEIRSSVGATGANTLNMGLVRKKRKAGVEGSNRTPESVIVIENTAPAAGMIRKKAKV
jgi:regulator of Ty1 transposition protein 109